VAEALFVLVKLKHELLVDGLGIYELVVEELFVL